MKKILISFSVFLCVLSVVNLFTDDSWNERKLASVDSTHYNDFFLDDIKPLLDNRCVVCHSCYNAPCQLKLSSYEGIDRGASKKNVYASRVLGADPTRLFVDAKTTKQWRSKSFYTVKNEGKDPGLMSLMINLKKKNPHAKGDFKIDKAGYYCPSKKKFKSYTKKKKWLGMPYGLPALKPNESALIEDWISLGMPGPSISADQKLKSIKESNLNDIREWENYLNKTDIKSKISSRYIYEHLFLAHINFKKDFESKDKSAQFFRLIRSRTPSGHPVDEIATTRPYDDPKVDKFFYRFTKIHSTIVHKTHITYELSKEKMNRYNELFNSESSWLKAPEDLPEYGDIAANPFLTFKDLSPKSRYKFLLDDAHYHTKTFIRGPVCKGQVALNVINDHFHAIYVHPDKDPTVNDHSFLLNNYDKLELPAKGDNNYFKAALSNYQKGHLSYTQSKLDLYSKELNNGIGLDYIWKGKDTWNGKEKLNDQWMLTIYRHYDSSTVLRGPVGGLPKTTWLLDYPIFERIYYNLVAGFNVYGNIRHQVSTRLYMDNLRVESEDNFMSLMSLRNRSSYRSIINSGASKTLKKRNPYYNNKLQSNTGIRSNLALKEKDLILNSLYSQYGSRKHNNTVFQTLGHKKKKFVRYLPEVSMLLIEGESSSVHTIFRNKYHKNVSYMFKEEKRYDVNKDTLSFINGVATSYPNIYFKVNEEDLNKFKNDLSDIETKTEWREFKRKYAIHRMSNNFWDVHDKVQTIFNNQEKKMSALLDLNRYVNE